MNLLGNLIWFLLVGVWSAFAWFVYGLVLCITVVGLPVGLQCFKFAGLSLSPFGKTVYTNFGKHPILNLLWLLFGGFAMAAGQAVLGILLSLTIIGIPFGKQCFKLASLSLSPFGANVR